MWGHVPVVFYDAIVDVIYNGEKYEYPVKIEKCKHCGVRL